MTPWKLSIFALMNYKEQILIKVYDSINQKYLKTYADKEAFIHESDFKQKEKHLLLSSLSSNQPVQELVEIFGLVLVDDNLEKI